METTIKLYALKADNIKSYIFSILFVGANVVFPQLTHLLPFGGQMLLPIYFFTLIAAYKYGFFTGLLTALASPLVNHLLFAMPPADVLPILLVKSSLLAIGASFMAYRTKDVRLSSLLMVILFYQFFGTIAEYALTGSLFKALQDVRMGVAGMLLQLFGGYYLLRALKRV